ncbi:ribonuclease III [Methanobrevibacter arboriphilus JCM 13429 = DSM 1125]|uniref:ribonuclease III n=1 Tax=Methanobrevibacter arboriphilus JCM 13429 = DSM 1125 TaxID=1300164 RepID=A0A1V6N055_METAZ|nr:ribonuclease III [Methanobrevibacter arboriphilus]OQD57987.1 ribonuclease III [Methanobrevibacter arboriphilus JCM 13429 = DSM 1125]
MKILDKFNIIPNNPKLFNMAFMHKSYGVKHNISYDYERLEFLGDAVLSMIVSDYLYKKYKNIGEGDLTKLRSNYVCETALANYSHELGLTNMIKLELDDNKVSINEIFSISADVFESLLGAIYLDQGIEKTREFLSQTVFPAIDEEIIFFTDFKSKIKEYGDANELNVEYKLIEEYGAPHDKTFVIGILVDNEEIGVGTGKSKKEAEQIAAQKAIEKLEI